MRLHAYVLAGDPAWIPQSIGSYYHLVERIVVSFDRSGRSWSGAPLSIDESLRRIAAADPEGKTVLLPGDHADPSRYVLRVETEQRQRALDAASEGADWVIQLDTDEILAAPDVFRDFIGRADERAAQSLSFPARMFYARTRSGLFLEHCGRFWSSQAGYPGPVAVRAGTALSLARQAAAAPQYRVDFAPWNTDPAHPRNVAVHDVIAAGDGILHLSWVRTEAQMAEKSIVSGYAGTKDWSTELEKWRRRAAHPRRTALRAPLVRDPNRRFRIARLPAFEHAEP
jgi:hypothetical protein